MENDSYIGVASKQNLERKIFHCDHMEIHCEIEFEVVKNLIY